MTGRVVEPDEADGGSNGTGEGSSPGRWRVLEHVENGRIRSTTRYPDLPGE